MAADSIVTRFLWLSAYVVVTFLSFPHPIAGTVIDFGIVLGWIGPALLIVGLSGTEPRRAAKLGFLAGTAAQTAILHWLYIVSVVYGHAPPVLGLLGPVGMGAHTGVFVALFSLSYAWFERRGRVSPWVVAGLWTTVEWLRTEGQIGFPWSVIGYTQHLNHALMGIAPYTGVYGLSFVTALAGAALARVVIDRRGSAAVWSAAAGVAALHVAGVVSFASPPDPDVGRETVKVAVLQGNIDQGVKWDQNWVERTVVIYEELSREAARLGAQVIVFPESAIPGALNADAALRYRMSQLARETAAVFVIGSIAREAEPGEIGRFYDSAFVLQADGDFTDRYDKSHLVPFGEYVPLGEWIGWLFKAVAQGMAVHGVTRGPGPRSVSLHVDSRTPSRVDEQPLTVGVPICYELLFPDLTRRFVDDGGQLLLAITNDAWYGRTGAPHQFLAITAVRSAENGVWTARAANTGVSAFIDSQGRVREQTAIFERGLLVGDLPVTGPDAEGTFYSRHGDVFAHGCALVVIVAALIGRQSDRSHRRADKAAD